MSKTPSYEELVSNMRPRRNWAQYVEGLEPGEVREVIVPRGVALNTAQTGVKVSADRRGINTATTTIDGVLYVTRLKDEDVL